MPINSIISEKGEILKSLSFAKVSPAFGTQIQRGEG